MINTIFASHLVDTKGRFEADEPIRQTTEIQAVSHSTSVVRGRDVTRLPLGRYRASLHLMDHC
jgi:hypothetical protein